MRIDSCRKCGIELEVNKRCDACRAANQFFCHNCSHVTDKQIHARCDLAGLDQSFPKATVA